ncbi:hypothetical protein [Robertkochia sediminum]|uniref:hypothetical protein n=1 Tax=Robertkochia sediminum TaxID=2785326 RepID=UPI001931887C|nr:hypothetical protein [Robertkochia sediminum]MBL7472980.1 hypothetical protein [Robertkochia sediminum]
MSHNYFISLITRITCLILITHMAFAQEEKLGHYIKDNQVIFVFSASDYIQYQRLRNGRFKSPDRVRVKEVSISGNFNNWSKDGIPMDNIGGGVFVLSQPLSIFKDQLTWDFKYLVNGKFWAEPDISFRDKVVAGTHSSGEPRYFLQLNTFIPNPMGNTLFRLPGHKDAKEVILTGSFNNWNDHALPMENTQNGWRLALDLEPGYHQYGFIVDGTFIADPTNDELIKSETLGMTSVLRVTKEVRLFLNTHRNARKVAVAGSFNNWQSDLDYLEWAEDGWEIKLELPSGKHHYKFVVDNSWITDPANPIQEYDTRGNINSVIVVD